MISGVPNPYDRLPDRAALAIGETALLELPFNKRIDAAQHRGLGHSVTHRGNAQTPRLAVLLRHLNLHERQEEIGPLIQRGTSMLSLTFGTQRVTLSVMIKSFQHKGLEKFYRSGSKEIPL